jgi:hypothetical protein
MDVTVRRIDFGGAQVLALHGDGTADVFLEKLRERELDV